MGRGKKRNGGDIQYDEEAKKVILTLRRPIYFNVPNTFLDSNYDPSRKIKKPASTLELEWVYGYRGRDSRNNIVLLASGEIVYFVAAVGIIYDIDNNTQRYYIGHNDDIKSIAVHPDGVTVASGQTCGRDKETGDAHVRIWSSETLETLHVFGMGDFQRSVIALAFSKEDDGAVLAAIDDGNDKVLSLWNWADEEKSGESKASNQPIVTLMYTGESPSRIVTIGKNHISFWTLNTENGRPAKKNGVFGTYDAPKFVTAVSFNSEYGEVVAGDHNGNITIWRSGSNTITKCIEGAHDGAIFCIYLTEEGTLVTGGKDGKIMEYDKTYEPTGNETTVPEEYGPPRQIVVKGETIIVGTTRNAIVKGTFDGDFEPLTQGHCEELWGLAVHPSENKFITAGLDNTVFMRDMDTHGVDWSKDIQHECKSAVFSPGGEVIVVGTTSGRWKVIKVEDQDIIFEGHDGDEAIQMIKFSPDGTKLALGSRDNNVYIYEVHEDFSSYTKYGVCSGHSSFIRQLDWSEDGTCLQTNSGDYEHLFWNIEEGCDRMDMDDTTDTIWNTNSCLLSFGTLGVWPEGVDGTDVNNVNKAHHHDILATADDFGKVKLFKYPASYQHMRFGEYSGHSSHVTSVEFSHDDSFLISTGGRDTATMQWRVNNDDEPVEDDED